MRKKLELESGCMAKAGENEMTFVLLSRDRMAPATIRFWAEGRVNMGLNLPSDPQITEALAAAHIMEQEGSNLKP